jgi:TonB family protein
VPRTTATGSNLHPAIGLDPTVPQEARSAPSIPLDGARTSGPPTTLGSAIGSTVTEPRKRSKVPLFAALGGIAVAGAAVAVLATRGGSSEDKPAPPPTASPAKPPEGSAPPKQDPKPPDPRPPDPKLDAPLISSKSLVRRSGEMPEVKSSVALTLCVDDKGAVTSVQVPDDVAADVATDVRAKVTAWAYEPYTRDGKAIAACTVVVIPAKKAVVAGDGSAKATPPAQKPEPPPDPCDDAGCAADPTRKCCRGRRRPRDPDEREGRNTLDRSEIQRGMATVRGGVQSCGDRAGVKGLVRVRVSVAASGAVSNVSVVATPDPGVNACVVAAVKLARFAAPSRPSTFMFPFVL